MPDQEEIFQLMDLECSISSFLKVQKNSFILKLPL